MNRQVKTLDRGLDPAWAGNPGGPGVVIQAAQEREGAGHNVGKHEGAQGFCGLVIENLISSLPALSL